MMHEENDLKKKKNYQKNKENDQNIHISKFEQF
jgi:hypothetical protein